MDPIADMLTIIRNGYMAKLDKVTCRKSKIKLEIAKLLSKHRFVDKVEEVDKKIEIRLLYVDKKPAITSIQRISKPGLRIYQSVATLKKKKSRHAIKLVSTPKGVMTDRDAIRNNVGGEVIAVVY